MSDFVVVPRSPAPASGAASGVPSTVSSSRGAIGDMTSAQLTAESRSDDFGRSYSRGMPAAPVAVLSGSSAALVIPGEQCPGILLHCSVETEMAAAGEELCAFGRGLVEAQAARCPA